MQKPLMGKNTYLIVAMITATALFLFSLLALAQQDQKEYIISVNDVLEISVYNESDLTKVVRVSEEGTINYPFLGNIKAAGFSVRELENRIREMLAEDYLVNPQVSIFVKEYAKISILGEVTKPGSYELKDQITVMQAIALAGGFSDTANPSKVKVIRKTGESEETFEVDTAYITEKADKSKDIVLKPGDVVFVEEYGRISVLGQVNRPGSYLLKKDLAVLEAIALAGGFTKIAAVDGTNVVRLENGRKRVIKIHVSAIMKGDKNYDIILLPGDTVIVPESFF